MEARTRPKAAEPAVADRRHRPRFRGDVDGLRAVAILLVVGYHVGLTGFGGGFIGVDVFFVISGFLITRNLVAETERSHRIRLLGFWAGRIRRLVPALALMVTATLAASVVILPRIEWPPIGTQGGAAALYVSNLLFARDAQDYFGPNIDQSPFLHTWSLGVEEQFYLLWPLLFAAVAWAVAGAARRRRATAAAADGEDIGGGGGMRVPLAASFVVVLVVSFAWNIQLSAAGSSWAFFGLPTRAWEFAAAGLLATLPLPRVLHPAARRAALAGGGLVMLAAATVTVDQTGYPGWWALLPVGATLAVVAAGDATAGPPTRVGTTLAARPLQWLGRVSYSWYLWHWPFIVLVAAALGNDSVGLKLAAAVASLGVAVVAHRLVENPLRFSRRLIASKPLTYGLGAAATVLVVLIAAGVVQASDAEDQGRSIDAQVAAAQASRREIPCDTTEVGANGASYCALGNVDAPRTVMLIGDSHARQWSAALAHTASVLGVRLVDRHRILCPALAVEIAQGYLQNGDMAGCDRYRQQSLELVDELHPDVVIISDSGAYVPKIRAADGSEPPLSTKTQLWSDAYRQLLRGLQDRHVTPLVLVDNPEAPTDPLDCVSKRQAIEPCQFTRDAAMASITDLATVEAKVRDELGPIATVDVLDVLCPPAAATCPLEIDGQLAYADESHLTDSFTADQEPRVEQVLRPLL